MLWTIVEKIPGGNIKELCLKRMDFSGIDSRNVAKSINSLQVFMPDLCFFDQSQIIETIEEILRKTNLKKLNLPIETLKNVQARILGKALNKMEFLTLSGQQNSLSSDQMLEIFREMSCQTNLRSLELNLPDTRVDSISVRSLPADILTKAINNLTRLKAPNLSFSGSQIKSVFQNIATNDSCRIRHLKLGIWNDFSLVDLKTLRAVNNKLPEINDFKRFLCVKIVEMSIKELLRFEEEGEEKLTYEEMCQRWAQVMCEFWETAQSLLCCRGRLKVFIPLQQRLLTALLTPLLLQMADRKKYNLNTAMINQSLHIF